MNWRSIHAMFVAVLLLFVSGSMKQDTVVSGMPMVDPDVTIHFRGLMLFENCTTGLHEQLVRILSDAMYHKVTIMYQGPGFPDLTEWVPSESASGLRRVHTKGEDLSLQVWNKVDENPLDANVTWRNTPWNIKDLHRGSSNLGDFIPVPNAFGPTFTLNKGDFIGTSTTLDFVSLLKTIPSNLVYTDFDATFDLDPRQVAVLKAANLAPGVSLNPRVLRKPGAGERKWEIYVMNEPDSDHVCGYHFLEYYKGFKYERGDVPIEKMYAAKPSVPGLDPCDYTAQAQAVSRADQKGQQSAAAIETRPCIPITFAP